MQRIVNRTLGFAGGLLVLGAGLAGCSSSKAEDWAFTDTRGSVRTLSEYQGQVLVLGFTNTWCEPCQDAAFQMQALHDRFADQSVKVLSVSCWERGDAEAWMMDHGFTYGLMINGTEIARHYNVDHIPTFYVIGVDGKVIARHEGFRTNTSDKIAKAVEKHLKKKGMYRAVAQHGG